MADCRPQQADDERSGEIAEAGGGRPHAAGSRYRFRASGILERCGRRRGGLWHDSLPHDIDDLTTWQRLERDHGRQIPENRYVTRGERRPGVEHRHHNAEG
jgi:hypothetical protein